MGLLARSLGVRAAVTMEDPTQPLLPAGALSEGLGLGGRTDSGMVVNERGALALPTAFSCIRILSEDLGSLPLGVFQHMPNGSVREAFEHPLYPLLRLQPNEASTSMTWREAMTACALAWGNAYALIERDRATRPIRFTILPPDRTGWVRVEGQLVYWTTATKDGQIQPIAPENMLHVPLFSFDGLTGISPIRNCMQAFGLALAAERYGAQFFGNGARATGILTHPGILDDESYDRVRSSVREWLTGGNALKPVLLEEGLKWEQISIAPEEAQFLETRRFQRAEIAGLYRVPLHMIADLDRATDSNVEHLSIAYVRHGLRPLAIRFEGEFTRKLLTGTFFVEHDLNDLTRGDFVSQTEGMRNLRDSGAFCVNDILRRLRMNTISASEGGEVRLAPLNMTSLASLAAPKDAAEEDAAASEGGTAVSTASGARRLRVAAAFRPAIRDVVGRALHRQAGPGWIAQALTPALLAMAEALYAMHAPGALTDEDRHAVELVAPELAAGAASWTSASAAATALTEQASERIAAALGF